VVFQNEKSDGFTKNSEAYFKSEKKINNYNTINQIKNKIPACAGIEPAHHGKRNHTMHYY
jgi:hypothetical protein